MASESLTVLGFETSNVLSLVLRMALSVQTPATAAVLQSIFALSALHRDGPNEKSAHLKVRALGALASSATGDINSIAAAQHVVCGLLLCTFEVKKQKEPLVLFSSTSRLTNNPLGALFSCKRTLEHPITGYGMFVVPNTSSKHTFSTDLDLAATSTSWSAGHSTMKLWLGLASVIGDVRTLQNLRLQNMPGTTLLCLLFVPEIMYANFNAPSASNHRAFIHELIMFIDCRRV